MPNDTLSTLTSYWWVIPVVLVLVLSIVLYRFALRLFGIVIVPDDSIGIVTKRFVIFGSNKRLPDGAIVALKGEAGIQVDPLAPGLHFFLWPWQYDIDLEKFVTVDQNTVGVVEARDGAKPETGRVLGQSVGCDSFQDGRKFLENGGQRGPQMAVITPGTYRINTRLFHVTAYKATEIDDKMVGVITTKDGMALSKDDIAGKPIEGHRSFQDGDAFIAGGGYRGLQEQVLLAGRYYLNPLFVTVETVPMTVVPIASAGVMISYVGEPGVDVTGKDFEHGNQVNKGQKGVWADPLDPGKYPVNPFTHKLECVSTANIVLNWATGKNESHMLDEKLSTIKLRSSDGFALTMDVSVIIHIPRNDAPKVIARFGNLQNLVTQVLEPLISNHFRNAAQQADAIEFLRNRTQRQLEAKETIKQALAKYNVVGVDTLIGDINPPAELMKTLTDRKIAEQEKVTFDTQREAAEQRQKLEQANALAATQSRVVDAERKVAIAEYDAQSAVKRAEGEAKAKTINAQADAAVLITVGEAEGKKITAVGEAEAEVIQKKTNAIGAANYALIETARSIAHSGQALVPQIVVSGGKDGRQGSLVDVLVAKLAKDGLAEGAQTPSAKTAPPPSKPSGALPSPSSGSGDTQLGNGAKS